MKISAIVIARNEKDEITQCLKTLSFTDEVILIDNNSSDNTANLGRKLGAKVYEENCLDFAHLRNIGAKKAQGNFLFYVDADERVTPKLREEILKVINDNNLDIAAYSITRHNYFLGKSWPKKEKMVRLIRRKTLNRWQGVLHETAIIKGNIGQLNSPLLHFTHKNLSEMLKKTDEWSALEARLRYEKGHPQMSWWRFFRVMFTSFWNSYILDGGWRIGITGMIESIYQAYSSFITYAKLWELQNKNKTYI